MGATGDARPPRCNKSQISRGSSAGLSDAGESPGDVDSHAPTTEHTPGWRPRALRDGNDPDPRFTLANERTFLAWIRTSLGLIAGAVALEAFAGDQIPTEVRTPLAGTLLMLAAVLSVVAFRRWIRLEQAMRHSRPLPLPRATIVLVVGVSICATLLVTAILMR